MRWAVVFNGEGYIVVRNSVAWDISFFDVIEESMWKEDAIILAHNLNIDLTE